MKLKLINYNVGPSKADNELIWVDSENDDKEFSPIFTDEDSAIMWHSMMQSYFCPNKNCHIRWYDSSDVLEEAWLSEGARF